MGEVQVSIGVITYFQEKYIRQCLNSILMQKVNFKYEIIIGEDCSPDNTREILLEYKKKYSDTIKLILHDENVGPAQNNNGVKRMATGKYYVGIEGDDFWIDENKLQKQFDFLESHPEYSAVGHNYYYAKPNGEVIYSAVENKKDHVYTMNDYFNIGVFIHCNTMFGRNYFINPDEKYMRLRNSYTTMGDIATLALFFDKGDIYYMGEPMLAHRLTDVLDSASFSQSEKKGLIKNTRMFFQVTDALDEYFDGKYDFSNINACRIGFLYYSLFFKRKDFIINEQELRDFNSSLSLKLKIKGFYCMFRKVFRKVLRKVRNKCNRT